MKDVDADRDVHGKVDIHSMWLKKSFQFDIALIVKGLWYAIDVDWNDDHEIDGV